MNLLINPQFQYSDVLNRIALFAAFCMFCSTIEYLFPRPLPFFRLGLANLPIILALPILNFRHLVLLTLLKVIGQGLVNGTFLSYVFILSMVGSFASFFVMYILERKLRLSYLGISLAGALASNTVQGLASVLFIFGRQSWLILPLFYFLGLIAGCIVGVLAEKFARESEWLYRQYLHQNIKSRLKLTTTYLSQDSNKPQNNDTVLNDGPKLDTGEYQVPARKKPYHVILENYISTPAIALTGLLSLIPFLLVQNPLARFLQVIILAVLVLFAGKKLNYLYFVFLMLSVVLFNLLVPQGKVLTTIATFAITEGALYSGLYRGLTIIGFVCISLFSIRKRLYIPGKLGGLITLTLVYFEQLYQQKNIFRKKNLIQQIDVVLFDSESDYTDASKRAIRQEYKKERITLRDLPAMFVILGLLILPVITGQIS